MSGITPLLIPRLILSILVFVIGANAAISPRISAPYCTISVVVNEVTYQLDSWGDDSIRLRASPGNNSILQIPPEQALLPTPPVSARGHTDNECIGTTSSKGHVGDSKLVNGNLMIEVLQSSSAIIVTRMSNRDTLILASLPSFNLSSRPTVYTLPYNLYSIIIRYAHLGSLYGLGEHRLVGQSDLAYTDWNHLFERSQAYSYSDGGDIMIPWYMSSAGFGVLLNHAGYGYVKVRHGVLVEWGANATHQLDMWFTAAPALLNASTPPYAALMSRYAEAVGHPNPLPKFASGLWASKNRHRNQSEVVNAINQFAAAGFPLSTLVIDYHHWAALGDWSFTTNGCWPDPASMVKYVQSFNDTRIMVSVWPQVENTSVNYKTMVENNYLTHDAYNNILISDNNTSTNIYLPDVFNPKTRDYIFTQLKKNYIINNNISIFWLDANEPQYSLPGQQYWYGHSDLEIGMKWCTYLQYSIYNGLLHNINLLINNIIMLSRSFWISSSLYNVIVWSGDITSSWDELAIQIRSAQNVALSGIYCGGYWSGNNSDASFQELQLRWFQFGAFCPIFRVHGRRVPAPPDDQCGATGGAIEPAAWTYAKQIRDIVLVRESIRTYVEDALTIASINGTPLLRPMFFDCTDDACLTASDQYMFGSYFVVAPIYVYQANNRTVYLPTGHIWTHYFTGIEYTGGQTYIISVTLNDFPLFVNNKQYLYFRNEYKRIRKQWQSMTEDVMQAIM